MSPARWNAVDYAANSQGQFAWALSVVDRLQLPSNGLVLDVGCGDGKVSAELARRVPAGRVVGIDSSEEMIELARATWSPSVPNLEFRIQDAQALDLPEVFDFAFSNSALHWMPDHPAVLKGVAIALKPGGRLAFSMGGRGTAAAVYEALAGFQQDGPWANWLTNVDPPHYFFGPEEYGLWLPQAGLRPQRLAMTPKPMIHAGLAALEGWLRTTWAPYTERVPSAERAAFVHALAERVRAGCGVGEEGRPLRPMVNLEVEAEKFAD